MQDLQAPWCIFCNLYFRRIKTAWKRSDHVKDQILKRSNLVKDFVIDPIKGRMPGKLHFTGIYYEKVIYENKLYAMFLLFTNSV